MRLFKFPALAGRVRTSAGRLLSWRGLRCWPVGASSEGPGQLEGLVNLLGPVTVGAGMAMGRGLGYMRFVGGGAGAAAPEIATLRGGRDPSESSEDDSSESLRVQHLSTAAAPTPARPGDQVSRAVLLARVSESLGSDFRTGARSRLLSKESRRPAGRPMPEPSESASDSGAGTGRTLESRSRDSYC